MPRKPKRPCRFPGCPNLTDGVYCEKHAKTMEQHYEKFQRVTRRASVTAGLGHAYGTATQTSIRLRDMSEGRSVQACGEVHHILPLAKAERTMSRTL